MRRSRRADRPACEPFDGETVPRGDVRALANASTTSNPPGHCARQREDKPHRFVGAIVDRLEHQRATAGNDVDVMPPAILGCGCANAAAVDRAMHPDVFDSELDALADR